MRVSPLVAGYLDEHKTPSWVCPLGLLCMNRPISQHAEYDREGNQKSSCKIQIFIIIDGLPNVVPGHLRGCLSLGLPLHPRHFRIPYLGPFDNILKMAEKIDQESISKIIIFAVVQLVTGS